MANEFKIKNGLIIKRIVPDVTADGASSFVFYKKDGTSPVISINTSTGAITGIANTGAVENSFDLVASGAMFTALAGKSDTGHTHSAATTSVAGFMSATDKTKLDGVATGATANAGTVTSVTAGNSYISVANGTTTPAISVNAAETGTSVLVKTNASGYLDASIIPSAVITDVFPVTNFSELTAETTARKGDVGIVSSTSTSYILAADDYSVAGNWKEITSPLDGIAGVAAGNGMTFTTVTSGTATVTMGTPGTITGSTSNEATFSVGVGSHTHALTVTSTDVGLSNVTNDAQVKKAASSTDGYVPVWSGVAGDALAAGYSVQTTLSTSATALVRADAIFTAVDAKIAKVGTTVVDSVPQWSTTSGALKAGLSVTTSPTESSGNLITSGAVFTGLAGKSDTGHTHSAATTSVAGFMSATDKTKLDGVATGANAYVHPTTAGNIHIPAAGASTQILQYSGTAGTAKWITLSGDATIADDGAVTIAADAVENTMLVNMTAESIKANATSSSANPADLVVAEQTLVGRITGGHVAALTAAEVITLLGIVAPSAISLATPASTTTTVDSFADTTSSGSAGVRYDYFIKDSGGTPANFRAGTVMVVYDGNSNVAEFYDTCTTDIGDTSGFAWTANITTGNVLLQAVVSATRGYNVRVVKTVI